MNTTCILKNNIHIYLPIFFATLTYAKKIFLDFVGFFTLTVSVSKLFDCIITMHKYPFSENLGPIKAPV